MEMMNETKIEVTELNPFPDENRVLELADCVPHQGLVHSPLPVRETAIRRIGNELCPSRSNGLDRLEASLSSSRLVDRPTIRRMGGVLLDSVCALVVAVVLVMNVLEVGPFHRVRMEDDVWRAEATEAARYIAAEIESFREEVGVLPPHLQSLEVPRAEQWEYEVQQSSSYRISLERGNQSITLYSSPTGPSADGSLQAGAFEEESIVRPIRRK